MTAGTFRPRTAEQVREVVEWAASRGQPVEIIGSGSKRAIGNIMDVQHRLDMSGLAKVHLFEPEELVVSAGPGMPVRDMEKQLAGAGFEFAFEPPDLSHLLGVKSAGTLGGMVASNLAGPRRLKAGAVRDHVLGISAVSGRGEYFRSGGRVVKNVTGYDLPKILTGSWGTLAVFTQVTLKVVPKADTEVTLCLAGLDNQQAIEAMGRAMRSSCEVSGAAHLPGEWTCLRLEGFGPSVAARLEKLQGLLKDAGDHEVLEEKASRATWQKLRDVRFLSTGTEQAVWRISVPPSEGARVVAAITDEIDARAGFDWAGGLIWLEVLNSHHAQAGVVRSAIARTGGHACLIRASDKARAGTAVFQPQPEPVAGLARRIRTAFDPENILNRGRMHHAD